MIRDIPDIDIDTADREKVLQHIRHIDATIGEGGDARKHNTGVYVTDIPFDPRTNRSMIDHKDAEDLGYIKLDILNMSVYENVKDETHLDMLMGTNPPWERLWADEEFCEKVVHIGNHYKSICLMKPDTVARMAMFLALIRPAKKHMIGKPWKEIATEIWTKPEGDEYFFKKSHAVSYAVLVQIHMNLLVEEEES